MSWVERQIKKRVRPTTKRDVERVIWLRLAFWALFIIVFVVLPITRPLWSLRS